MTEHIDLQSQVIGDLVHKLHHLAKMRDRQAHVTGDEDVTGVRELDRVTSFAPGCPQDRPLLRCIGNLIADAVVVHADLTHIGGLVFHGRPGAVELDEQSRRLPEREVLLFVGDAYRACIEQLDGGHIYAIADRIIHRGCCIVQRLKDGECGRDLLRQAHQPQRDLGNDAQGPL